MVEIANWKIYPQNETLQEEISRALSISRKTAQILINRGIRTKEEANFFINGNLNNLHDPFLMRDMAKAVERVFKAKKDKEKVLVFGDYDADGITGTSLLLIALREFGLEPSFYIPNRLTEGYGLNEGVISKAKSQGFSLLITTDTGIGNFKEAELAKKNGLDVIVTDHHLPDESLPDAFAVLNPRQEGCSYPFKELAGVGIAYKFVQALLESKRSEELLNQLTALSAFGTIADVSSLTGENRILVKAGLGFMRNGEFPWMRELTRIAGLGDRELSTWHIGFILAPMVNAAGRLGSANCCVNLMTTRNKGIAEKIAVFLNRENRSRQTIEKGILEEAKKKIEGSVNLDDDSIIVLSDDGWHPGVLGIVASRISEFYRRPSVLIGQDGRGSARSAADFNIYAALRHCSMYLKSYGGHKSAAGLRIEKEEIENFHEKIKQYSREHFTVKGTSSTIWADCEIELKDISFSLTEEIHNLAPFGISNPEPCFFSANIRVEGESRIVGNGHLKLKIGQDSVVFDSIGFNMGGVLDEKENHKDYEVIYSPSFDTWKGRREIQLKLKGLRERQE